MTWPEVAERCVEVSCARSSKTQTLSAPLSRNDVSIEERTTGIHLSIRSLTSVAAKAVVMEVQKQPTIPIIIHLLPSILDKACELDLNLQHDLVTCLRRCKMPVVTVCMDDVLVGRDQCLLVVLADMVIMSESSSLSRFGLGDTVLELGWEARTGPVFRHILAQTYLTKRPMSAQDALKYGLVDIVAPINGIGRELDLVLIRFSKVGVQLVNTCKSHLPTTSVDEAALVMAELTLLDKEPFTTIGDLVRITVSQDGVATVELNDPVGFNWESPELMADLVMRLQQVRDEALAGRVKAMVLQGAGPHFCTGGGRPDGSIPVPKGSWSELVVAISDIKSNRVDAP